MPAAGAVFALQTDGTGYQVLHHFSNLGSDASYPFTALLLSADGWLVGTTQGGGAGNRGALFALRPDGTEYQLVHSFRGDSDPGVNPQVGPALGPDGTLYGTTPSGGAGNLGAVYRVQADGTGHQVLHSFLPTGGDGTNPQSGVILASDGKLYGTTPSGGTGNQGTVYRLHTDGTGVPNPAPPHRRRRLRVLYRFDPGRRRQALRLRGLRRKCRRRNVVPPRPRRHRVPGAPPLRLHGQLPLRPSPPGRLMKLYGTTENGGNANFGTLFRIDTDGSHHEVLHHFAGAAANDGANPATALAQAPNGTLYGTTLQGGTTSQGTLFRLEPDGTGYALLHHFTSASNGGYYPRAPILVGNDGLLYGTTQSGGAGYGGTLFTLNPDGSGLQFIDGFSYNAAGSGPMGNLVQDPAGRLYGVAQSGGAGAAVERSSA